MTESFFRLSIVKKLRSLSTKNTATFNGTGVPCNQPIYQERTLKGHVKLYPNQEDSPTKKRTAVWPRSLISLKGCARYGPIIWLYQVQSCKIFGGWFNKSINQFYIVFYAIPKKSVKGNLVKIYYWVIIFHVVKNIKKYLTPLTIITSFRFYCITMVR